MSELTELYQKLTQQIEEIGTSCLSAAKTEAILLRAQSEADAVETVKDRLKQLEEYERVILWCRGVAEKHITSVNTLPITPREIDMSKIRGWTRLIDPNSYDDPYARRVYTLAKSNELYIENKQKQLQDILTVLGEEDEQIQKQKILKEHEDEIRTGLKKLLEGDDFHRLQELLQEEKPAEQPEENA